MTDAQKPKDLTAQLATAVREVWEARHSTGCYRRACEGDEVNCTVPKPTALVAYEQEQQGKASVPGNDLARLACHCPARIGDLCQLTSDECRTRQHDLRADGAGEQQAPDAAPSKPALAYVLTRGDADAPDSQQLQVYTSEAAEHAANHDRAVLQQFDTAGFTYRVYAVPMVE